MKWFIIFLLWDLFGCGDNIQPIELIEPDANLGCCGLLPDEEQVRQCARELTAPGVCRLTVCFDELGEVLRYEYCNPP